MGRGGMVMRIFWVVAGVTKKYMGNVVNGVHITSNIYLKKLVAVLLEFCATS